MGGARARDGRVVAFRWGALGDALLAMPALAWLRRRRPMAHVVLIAREDVLPLARASGLAEETAAIGDPVWGALFHDEVERAGATSTLVRGSEAAIAWIADPDRRIERNLRALGARHVVTAPGMPSRERVHTALLLASGLAGLGIAPPHDVEELVSTMPPLKTPEGERGRMDDVWRALGLDAAKGPVVAFHAGSGSLAKRWPAGSFGRLAADIQALGGTPLAIEGPQDADVIREAQAVLAPMAAAGQRPEPAVARGLGVGTLAGLLARCDAYVGNDSGVTHLAALTGTPSLALFGPSDPGRWRPLGKRVRVIASATGRVEDITVAEALAGLEDLLSDT